jgi:hypothetical protein
MREQHPTSSKDFLSSSQESERDCDVMAEKWLHENYTFPFDRFSDEARATFKEGVKMRLERAAARDNEGAKKEYGGEKYGNEFRKIEETPELTEDEYHAYNNQERDGKFGGMNNFWAAFRPDLHKWIQNELSTSSSDAIELHWMLYGDFVGYLSETGILHDAFEDVGFARVKRMHESIAENNGVNFEANNTMRLLCIALHKRGVPFKSMHR